jgi:hypothetical protein
MFFFIAPFDVTESQCITYVTVDFVCIDFQPFCFSECIGPESFSAWNLLWHHPIYCFRALRHGIFVRWAMHISHADCGRSHRSTDANCKIKIYCDVTRHSIQADSSHGGKDMQTLHANETNKWFCEEIFLEIDGEQIIYSRIITKAWNESNLSTEYKNWIWISINMNWSIF